ncbi:MAG: single-stranded DNA-binding protein [Candidatus Omnitrophota bacterium]|nr:MAG: single-stranded DNA-binding protein [Candidatus Omnitrophota bacterium]
MTGINRVFVGGNLTRDPELRYTPQGSPVLNFSIAINRTYTTQSGERKEEVEFVRIVVWGKQAETCSRYLSKGSSVLVEGRLSSRSWEGQDGVKRNITEVVANRVHFLTTGKTGEEGFSESREVLEADIPKEAGSKNGEYTEEINGEQTPLSEMEKPPF